MERELVTTTGMKIDLLWFVPASLLLLTMLGITTVKHEYHDLKLLSERFTWLLFLSPLSYLYCSFSVAALFVPPGILLIVPPFFDRKSDEYRHRYLWSGLTFVIVAGVNILLQGMAYASFPLPLGSDGQVRLRLVPFISPP